jgi:hypothetical protein
MCLVAVPLSYANSNDWNDSLTLTAYEYYANALNLEKTIPAYRAMGKISTKDNKYSYHRITYVKNTASGGHWVLVESRDLKTARKTGFTFLVNDEGQYFYNNKQLIKVSNDFIEEDIFYVQYFRALPHSDGQYSFLQEAPDGNIIVVRTITGSLADMLAEKIAEKSSKILNSLRNKKTRYPGVTDNTDIVPIKAFYRISIESGLIMEETYFNKEGRIISSPRKYDLIDSSIMPSDELFSLPSGNVVIFAKDAEESWALIKRL